MSSDAENNIRNLLSRYSQILDERDLDEWSKLFTADATLEMLLSRVPGQSDTTHVGREAIKAAMSFPRPPGRVGMHVVLNSIIEVSGDRGTASSDFIFFCQEGPEPPVILLRAGRFSDVLVEQEGKWLFQHRTIKVTMSG